MPRPGMRHHTIARRAQVRARAASALLLLSAGVGCQKHLDVSPHRELGGLNQATGVAARAGSPADDGQWTMPAKDYENTRFSGLDQLTSSNVKNLRLVWTQTTGVKRGHE